MSIENDIVNSLKVRSISQSQITTLYCAAILSPHACLDWPKMNRAILAKWSESGLIKIKRDAHKMAKEVLNSERN